MKGVQARQGRFEQITQALVGRLPHVLSGVGILFGLILLGELAVLGLSPVYDGFLVGVVTSIPFIAGHFYGGYWLEQSAIPPGQYSRIARWWVVGVLGTVLVIVWINMSMRSMSPHLVLGTVRWSGAIGGSLGLTTGILQARAIQQALDAQRVRYRLQETQQQRDQLEEFADIVSHDLRNPLSVAEGRLRLAKEECDSEHLQDVARAHERMNDLINDLLRLARQGNQVDELEPVDLMSLTQNCWHNVDIADATLLTDVDRRIQADRNRLQQLLENLIRNAVEHGGADVTVTIGGLDDGFYIEDDGPGIPEGERDDVFEVGYSTTEDGTGFGLKIVKQVAQAHGWAVRLTEGSDGGARFEITGVEFSAE